MTRLIWLVLTLALAATACTTTPVAMGTLQGNVHIGPITPVEKPGYKPPVSPEVFAARKILVYSRDRSKLIAQVDIKQIGQSDEGFFTVQLKPGTYLVDINSIGIDHSGEVPKQIEIKPGQTIKVNIDIDTGIR